MRGGSRFASRVRVVFVALLSIAMLVPMYIMVVNAFKPQQEILRSPLGLDPDTASTDFLAAAWSNTAFPVLDGYAVTLFLVLACNLVAIGTAVPAAYVIARTPTPLFRFLLLFFLAGMFIPPQIILVPAILVLKGLGLMGTIPGLVLFMSATMVPFTLFIFTGYIRMLPRSLDEAAAIDGAGRQRVLWTIVFPLMKPIVATAFILNALSAWNDFVSPQLILGPGSEFKTITTGVYAAVSSYSTNYEVVFPTLLLAVVPILVIFIVMQRFIMSGLATGSVKG
ncbi:MAG TPA: carbohydrate ABC transporter permease [Candidatus Ruania gallistercoris]|uniref:Carbohydrate ABC transporter permease n=1 Tax=Candidatus Ruania gallistercoris TaxID=2838746 RepID=A0A9D2ED14_9MICO|nr:carbohydrate ABC transporter permease [Candidatus Ruania gallistercoris]